MRRAHLATVAAVGAAALGGAAFANAASSGSSSATSTAATPTTSGYSAQPQGAPPARRDPSLGGHQANGKTEKLLTGDTAAKVKAAALAKVPGARSSAWRPTRTRARPMRLTSRRATARK